MTKRPKLIEGTNLDDETSCNCPVCDLDQLIAKTEQLIVRMKETRDTLTESSAAEWTNYELVSPTDGGAK